MAPTKRLYLIRHSYAESGSGKPDMERQLTSEGVNYARLLGRRLIKSSFNPALILCSPSVRTKETAANMTEELEINALNIKYENAIYNASVRELLMTVNGVPDDKETVALIGHNPAITYFAEYVTGASIGSMDPCSMVTIDLQVEQWSEMVQGTGIFVSHYHPKQQHV